MSVSKLVSQRVAILIDAQNILIGAKAKGGKPNYRKIMESINGREIVGAIIYAIVPELSDPTLCFNNAVEQVGYEIRQKPTKRLPDGSVKADWDMQIAIDALALSEKVGVMVLLTGDTDFVPLVHALKAKGVKGECMAIHGTIGKSLIEAVESYREITEDMLIIPSYKKTG